MLTLLKLTELSPWLADSLAFSCPVQEKGTSAKRQTEPCSVLPQMARITDCSSWARGTVFALLEEEQAFSDAPEPGMPSLADGAQEAHFAEKRQELLSGAPLNQMLPSHTSP